MRFDTAKILIGCYYLNIKSLKIIYIFCSGFKAFTF